MSSKMPKNSSTTRVTSASGRTTATTTTPFSGGSSTGARRTTTTVTNRLNGHVKKSDDESFAEYEAAFVSVVKEASSTGSLVSKQQLLSALQTTGRNPTKRALSKYWSQSTESLNFDEFCQICKKEPATSEEDLIKAFKKIDINGDGFISHSELKKVMSSKGERMTDEEISQLIDDVDENKDGKLDYKEFCKMILDTSKQCREKAVRRLEKRQAKDSTSRSHLSEQTPEKKTLTTPRRSPRSSPRISRSSTSSKTNDGKNIHSEIKELADNGDSDDTNELKSKEKTTPESSQTGLRRGRIIMKDREKLSTSRSNRHSTSLNSEDRNQRLPKSSYLLDAASDLSIEEDVHEEFAASDTEELPAQAASRASLRSSTSLTKASSSSKSSRVTSETKKDKDGSSTSLHSNDRHSMPSQSTITSKVQDQDSDDADIVIPSAAHTKKSEHEGSSTQMPKPRPRLSSLEGRKGKEDSPKPAPRRMSKQENRKSAVSSLNLKLSAPKKLNDYRPMRRRGMFYKETNGTISSTQFSLVITQATNVWITIAPRPSKSTARINFAPLDVCLFVVRDKPDRHGHLVTTFTEKRDSSGKYGLRADLNPGKYQLLAYTSGCHLSREDKSRESQKKLLKKKSSGEYAITSEFKSVLGDIFEMVDTDMNGLLNREEFNQYSLRTGEEEVGDDEWGVVKDNVELKHGELTQNGFIQLVELEAEDAEGDTDDLWVSLEAMGYNNSLLQTQAYPYVLEVYLENDDDAVLKPSPTLLSSKSKVLVQILQEAFTSKGELLPSDHRTKGRPAWEQNDVRIYVYESEAKAVIIIENKLSNRVAVKLDLSGSRNVKSSTQSLTETVVVSSRTSVMACYLVPENENMDWSFSCLEKGVEITT